MFVVLQYYHSDISGTKHGKQILFTYFLHLMRCPNCWDNKNFRGVKSGPPSPATSVKLYIYQKRAHCSIIDKKGD